MLKRQKRSFLDNHIKKTENFVGPCILSKGGVIIC